MKEKLETLYDVYCNLYNEQLEAAEPGYEEYFTNEFAPPDEPWTDKETAASSMNNLLGELYESCDNIEEVLSNAGLTEELQKYFDGLETI